MKHFLKNKGKRLTAAVLSAVMCLMALPMSAFAFTAEEGKSVEAYYGSSSARISRLFRPSKLCNTVAPFSLLGLPVVSLLPTRIL